MREECIRLLPESDDAADQLAEFVYEEPAWILSGTVEPNESNGTSEEHVYANEDNGTVLRYVADKIVGFSYIVVHGTESDAVISQLAPIVAFLSDEQVLSSWDCAQTWEEKVEAILRLAVIAPPASMDRRAHALRISSALRDEGAEVRDACLLGMSYRRWDELKTNVFELMKAEPDELVRKRATLLLSRWDDED